MQRWEKTCVFCMRRLRDLHHCQKWIPVKVNYGLTTLSLLVISPQTCTEGFAYDRRARQCIGKWPHSLIVKGHNLGSSRFPNEPCGVNASQRPHRCFWMPSKFTALYSRCGRVSDPARCVPGRHALCEPERRLPVHPEDPVQPAVQTGDPSRPWAGLPRPVHWIFRNIPPISSRRWKIRGAQLPQSEDHCAVHPGIYSCRGRHL